MGLFSSSNERKPPGYPNQRMAPKLNTMGLPGGSGPLSAPPSRSPMALRLPLRSNTDPIGQQKMISVDPKTLRPALAAMQVKISAYYNEYLKHIVEDTARDLRNDQEFHRALQGGLRLMLAEYKHDAELKGWANVNYAGPAIIFTFHAGGAIQKALQKSLKRQASERLDRTFGGPAKPGRPSGFPAGNSRMNHPRGRQWEENDQMDFRPGGGNGSRRADYSYEGQPPMQNSRFDDYDDDYDMPPARYGAPGRYDNGYQNQSTARYIRAGRG